MSFKQISQIAGSAMAAQTVRLNTIASNLANAQSASGVESETYRARKPVFAAVAAREGLGEQQLAGTRVQVLKFILGSLNVGRATDRARAGSPRPARHSNAM